MANTYIARGVTLTAAGLAGGTGEVLLTNGTGTFTVVNQDSNFLEIVSGTAVRPLQAGQAVNVTGLATVRPPGIGAFLIRETMSVQNPKLPVTLEGPIFLAVKGVHQPAAAAAK